MHSTRSGKPRRPREPVRWILPGTGTLCPPDVERRLAAPPPALQGPAQPLLGLEHRHVGELSARLVALQDHRSEEHTSDLVTNAQLVCSLLLEKKKINHQQ